MRTSGRAEWTGYACGLAIAILLWFGLHNREAEADGDLRAHIPEVSWGQPEERTVHEGTGAGSGGENATEHDERDGASHTDIAHTQEGRSAASGDPAPAGSEAAEAEAALHLTVRVYITKERRVESVPLETYVRGVVAGEMPADFEPAALEAQALAARTYIIRRLLLRDDSGVPAGGADVTDTQTHQVYLSRQAMDELRQKDEPAWRKANEAASRTAGWIIGYRGEPIQALYFSTSNGFTENSEDVFPDRIPYLRSVESPWDRKGAPRSEETITMTLRQFYEKLGIRTVPVLSRLGGYPAIKLTAKTQGNRVKSITVGGKSFTGQEVRSRLGLHSASFSWNVRHGDIQITTYGSGHGVGMSQWGAQGMALAGKSAEEIVRYYYTGTELMKVSNLADKL
jgi:stage II sporulation protein D